MRLLRWLALLLAAGGGEAATIVLVDSPNTNNFEAARITKETAFATGWTQTGSYTNVSVSALLYAQSNSGLGSAYLMHSIGSATTPADQIAFTPFSVLPSGNPLLASFIQMFSGLTLGPGTYYL